MIVFSEASIDTAKTKSAEEVNRLTEIAKIMGAEVFYIPKDFSICENAENAMWQVPEYNKPVRCFWVGFIPSLDRYTSIYNEAAKKNIYLLNSVEEHRKAQEFDYSYPLLEGLTPESITITSVEECEKAIEQLGVPLFIRGSARSDKVAGWKACVAENLADLQNIVNTILRNSYRSRGRAIVRKLVRLRYSRESNEGFPLGREFRVFLYKNRVVGAGYYWDGDDPLMTLTEVEEKEVISLATEAAKRVNVPFIAVDVGQLEDETWIVIEVNDAQFAGYGHIELLEFWRNLEDAENSDLEEGNNSILQS